MEDDDSGDDEDYVFPSCSDSDDSLSVEFPLNEAFLKHKGVLNNSSIGNGMPSSISIPSGTTPRFARSSAVHVPTSNRIPEHSRSYTQWGEKETAIVVQYFQPWMDRKALPGKKEILVFKSVHPAIKHNWKIIKTKVMNESTKQKRCENVFNEMKQ